MLRLVATYTEILAGILLILIATIIRRRYFSPLSNVPGPILASISRLWHAYHIFQGDHNTVLLALHAKHGHFVRIAPNEVSVSHPDGPVILLKGLLRKGDWYRVFAMPDWRFVTPQSTLDPEEKIQRSKRFVTGFSLTHLLRSEDHFDDNIGLLLDWMDRYSENYEPMNLDKFFTYTAFDNAGEAVFSQPFGFISRGEDVGSSIRNSRSLNRYLAIAGYYIWFHRLFIANPIITWLGILPMGHLHKISRTALEQRKRNPDARFDIVAHWLRTHHERPEKLTLRELEAQATVSVAAGSDTMSCALQAFVYFMIRHPESWERARDEIRVARAKGRCKTRVISYEDSINCLYLKACVYEAMRMFGPGPFGFPRVTPPGGIRVGDAFFEQDTVLSVNPQVMQQSDECWGHTSKEWKPERWLVDNAFNSNNKYWLVFGLGFNKCPGKHLALLQIFKTAATIVRDYSIKQVDPKSEWQWKAYFTVVPECWPVYITKTNMP